MTLFNNMHENNISKPKSKWRNRKDKKKPDDLIVKRLSFWLSQNTVNKFQKQNEK